MPLGDKGDFGGGALASGDGEAGDECGE